MSDRTVWTPLPPGDPRPPVMVVSHERSGTHFLMNTLESCFGYRAMPWINFDRDSVPVNFHSPRSIQRFFEGLAEAPPANVIKSHHCAAFFEGSLDMILERVRILYIHRHPLTTLRSWWKLIERASWREGPEGLECEAFLRAAPMGYCMRYQMVQEPTMLHRWTHHVEGWMELARERGEIVPVRYEALDERFEETVDEIGRRLGIEPTGYRRPDRHRNVVMASKGVDYAAECLFGEESLALVEEVAGDLLRELGYEVESPS